MVIKSEWVSEWVSGWVDGWLLVEWWLILSMHQNTIKYNTAKNKRGKRNIQK